MQSEFVKILDDIEASNYDPETKVKLQTATMLLWSLQDAKNGGTGVVSWNRMEISASNNLSPVTPSAVVTEVVVQEEPKPKEIEPKEKKTKKVKIDLQKDLNINIDDINFDDLISGF